MSKRRVVAVYRPTVRRERGGEEGYKKRERKEKKMIKGDQDKIGTEGGRRKRREEGCKEGKERMSR